MKGNTNPDDKSTIVVVGDSQQVADDANIADDAKRGSVLTGELFSLTIACRSGP